MAVRTPAQLARQRHVERVIRAIAPALDVVLGVGDAISRVAGRGAPEPDPPPRRSVEPPARQG